MDIDEFKARFEHYLSEARPDKPNHKSRPKREPNKQTNQADGGKQSERRKVYWHGQVDYRESRPYLVQDCIPEVGHGLISGQWGTFKTFSVFDLAHSCMSGEPFLGYEIMRRGGVLLIAVEGGSEVPIRLQAVIEDRGKIEGLAPFTWIDEDCPPLIGEDAADEICAIAEPVAKQMKEQFDLPLVLIVVDTIIAGAGYTKDGQDNDAAAGQAVMNTLKAVAKRTGTFVFGVDHFGKTGRDRHPGHLGQGRQRRCHHRHDRRPIRQRPSHQCSAGFA
jgi:hypothetical protein